MNKTYSKKKSYFEALFLIIKIWKFLKLKRKKQLFLIFLLMLTSALSEIITIAAVIPFLSVISNKDDFWIKVKDLSFIENGFLKNANDLIFFSILLFALAALITAIIRVTNIFLNTRLAGEIASDLSCQCYWNKIHQPYEYHLTINTSKVINSMTYEIRMTMNSINMFLQIILSLVITLSLITTLIIIDWQICIISSFCLSSIYLFIASFSNSRLRRNSSLISQKGSFQVKSMQEGLGSIRNLIMENNHNNYLSIYEDTDRPMRIAEAQNIAIGNFPRYVLESLGIIILSFISLILIKRSTATNEFIPLLGTFALASQRLIPSMQQIYGSWAGIVSYSAAVKNIIHILNLKNISKRIDSFNIPTYQLKNSFELKTIDYRYKEASSLSLEDINLKINKGEKIGIIGKTGVGKSTLLDIIMSLLKPTKGKILIDNIQLYNSDKLINEESWRQSISHVPQSIFLADESITKNIAFGIPENKINFSKVKKVAELASIKSFIENLKYDYDTRVGERGIMLSGGQRQRIGIARALYRDSSLLILDEATSALDSLTEKKILEDIFFYKKNLTIIMVAHRLSTLSVCDRIINLERGKIKEIMDNQEFKKKYL